MSDTPKGLEIVPLTPDTWTMFDAMVARHNGIFGGCWCIWFHPDSDEFPQLLKFQLSMLIPLLQEAEGLTNHLTCRQIPAALDLAVHQLLELGCQRHVHRS